MQSWEFSETQSHSAMPAWSVWGKNRFFNTEFEGEATEHTEPRRPREAP